MGVVGCRYWGPQLVRNLHDMPDVELVAVCDPQPQRLDYVASKYREIDVFAAHRELLATDLEAVVIATASTPTTA